MKNYLMSSLAIVGAVSLIIMACSADNSNNPNNQNSTASTNAVGKYQISSYSQTLSGTNGNSYRYFDVIDTETGVVKSYYQVGGGYVLLATTATH
jgi:hypothetical protein